jgi:restriction system protein
LAEQLIFTAMTLLKDAPAQSMKGSELLDLLPAQTELDEWALEIIESNGMPRWRTYALFFSIDSVKAGYLAKSKGIWTLTSTGVQALALGSDRYFVSAQEAYRKWRKEQLSKAGEEIEELAEDGNALGEQLPPEVRLEQLRIELHRSLSAEILERIKSNSWQFFERLVISVLMAMGYGRTSHGAQAFQRGSDGGIDGFINQDRLGLELFMSKPSVGAPNNPSAGLIFNNLSAHWLADKPVAEFSSPPRDSQMRPKSLSRI